MIHIFTPAIFNNLLNTAIALLLLVVIAVVVYFIFSHKFITKKRKSKFMHRLVYVMTIIFLLILTRIWVEGFTHLFTMLSLVAAGLVVTNKESIMNFVGWLIINWRGSFSEGDFVTIQNYCGYVSEIGPFYFRMYEVLENSFNKVTGVTIRLPNSLVITNPIRVIVPDTNLCLFSLSLTLMVEDMFSESLTYLQKLMSDILEEYYHGQLGISKKQLSQRKQDLANRIDLEPKAIILELTNAEKAKVNVSFYCYPKDLQNIEQLFWIKVVAAAHEDALKLVASQ